jgi:hypothetical protein
MATQSLVNGVSNQACIPRCGCDEDLRTEMSSPTGLPRAGLLGLPCARCKAYFAADLAACPICGCKEKVPLVKM